MSSIGAERIRHPIGTRPNGENEGTVRLVGLRSLSHLTPLP